MTLLFSYFFSETDSLEQNDNHSNENFNKNDEDYHDKYIAEVMKSFYCYYFSFLCKVWCFGPVIEFYENLSKL